MLKLYTSLNDPLLYEKFLDHLLLNLSRLNVEFANTQLLIVPNLSFANWLRDKITLKFGICAQIKFITLNDYINQTYLSINSKHKLFNFKNSKFLIYEYLLKINIKDNDFAEITQFIYDNNILNHNKAFQLATQLAAIFDEYIYLRTSQIINNKMILSLSKWQQKIWNHVIFRINNFDDEFQYVTFIDIYNFFVNNSKSLVLNQTVFMVGINSIYPSQLEILLSISKTSNIIWYSLSVTHEYYGDLLSSKAKKSLIKKELQNPNLAIQDLLLLDGNSLVANLGQQSREFNELILAYDITQEVITDSVSPSYLNNFKNLLELIQYDIKKLFLRVDKNLRINANNEYYQDPVIINYDNSIKINVCHNRLREVQVLFNELARIKAKNPDIQYADILVLAPDIRQYETFIQAVFNNETVMYQVDTQHFEYVHMPYQISSNYKYVPTILAMKQLFNLGYFFNVQDFIDFLNQEEIIQNFVFSSIDLDLIQKWFYDNNTYFGYEKQDLNFSNYKEFDIFSFRRFICNIVLGFCIPSELAQDNLILPIYEDNNQNQVYAFYDNLENSEIALANKIIVILDFIQKARDMFYIEPLVYKPIVLTNLVILIEEYKTIFATLEYAELVIDNLIGKLRELMLCQEITLPIVNQLIDDCCQFGGSKINFSGKITFANIQLGRYFPFKVIYVLGMNVNEFPRLHAPNKLSFLHDHWYLADRNINLEDKQTFLEIITLAQKYLFFSYIGKNDTDNCMIQPSVCLDLFINVLRNSVLNSKDILDTLIIENHLLHAFLDTTSNNIYSHYWQNITAVNKKINCLWLKEHQEIYKHYIIVENQECLLKIKDLINTFVYSNINLYKLINIKNQVSEDKLIKFEEIALLSKNLQYKIYYELKKFSQNELLSFKENNTLYSYLLSKGILSYGEISHIQFNKIYDSYCLYLQLKGNGINMKFVYEKYNIQIDDIVFIDENKTVTLINDFNNISLNLKLNEQLIVSDYNNYMFKVRALIYLLLLKYANFESELYDVSNINTQSINVYYNLESNKHVATLDINIEHHVLLEEVLKFYHNSLTYPTFIHKTAIYKMAMTRDFDINTVNNIVYANFKNFDTQNLQKDRIWHDNYAEYLKNTPHNENSLIQIAKLLQHVTIQAQ